MGMSQHINKIQTIKIVIYMADRSHPPCVPCLKTLIHIKNFNGDLMINALTRYLNHSDIKRNIIHFSVVK